MTNPNAGHGRDANVADGKRYRLLCADDDTALATMLKKALEHAGYAVECVDDGDKALSRIIAAPGFFDVLITDHQMPSMSGLGLISKLRDTSFSGAIIVHSSALSEPEKVAYERLAVDAILSKPVQLSALLAVIQRQIAGSQH
jgi:DNA-binding response OmpR family regulator